MLSLLISEIKDNSSAKKNCVKVFHFLLLVIATLRVCRNVDPNVFYMIYINTQQVSTKAAS